MQTSRTKWFLIAPLVLQFCLVAQTGPVAVDRFGTTGRLYVLDEGGRIIVSSEQRGGSRVLARVPAALKALDILSTRLWEDREMLFVTAYGLTSEDSRSRIIQYSPAGQVQCEWILPEVSAGLDVNTNNHVIYLSGASTATLYSLQLLRDTCYGRGQLRPVLRVRNARRLGPLVVDSQRNLAFVADMLRGTIFRVDLFQRQSVEAVGLPGQPVALLYEGLQHRLYVADGAGRKIWRVNVSAMPVPAPDVVSMDAAFQEPNSLTFAPDGKLLVGDLRAGRIFVVDWSGAVVGQIPVGIGRAR